MNRFAYAYAVGLFVNRYGEIRHGRVAHISGPDGAILCDADASDWTHRFGQPVCRKCERRAPTEDDQ